MIDGYSFICFFSVVGSDISADGAHLDRSDSNNLLAAFLTFTSIVIRDTRCK